MGKARTIFSGVFWSIIQNIANIVYGILSVPFLIDYFGKEHYGLIGLALSVNVYIQLLDMGMTNTNIRFFSESITKKDTNGTQRLMSLTMLFYIAIGILNTIILFAVSFYVNDLFNVTADESTTLRNLLWILGINATFSWLIIVFDQYLKAHNLISWIQKRNIILRVLQFVILAATILFHLSIETYFMLYVFMGTLILPLSMLKSRRLSPDIHYKPQFDKTTFKLTFPYAINVFSFSIFGFITLNFRPLFLGNLTTPAVVADYSIMETISKVVTIISTSFTQVLLPVITPMVIQADHEGITKLMLKGTKLATLLISGIVFLLIASINEIFTLYVGEQYTTLSLWMTCWLLTLLLSHRNVMTSLAFTERRLKDITIMSCFAMCLALILYALLIPVYGVGGVVIGFAAHELTHTLFYYLYFLPGHFHLDTRRVFIHAVAPVWLFFGLACATTVASMAGCTEAAFPRLILKSLLLGAVFLIVTRFVILKKEERSMLLSLIKKNRK